MEDPISVASAVEPTRSQWHGDSAGGGR